MAAYQASRRGGEVGVRVEGEIVELTGQAVTMLIGELQIAYHGVRAVETSAAIEHYGRQT